MILVLNIHFCPVKIQVLTCATSIFDSYIPVAHNILVLIASARAQMSLPTYVQSHQSLRIFIHKSTEVDEKSDQNFDPLHCWIHQHGCSLLAFGNMG